MAFMFENLQVYQKAVDFADKIPSHTDKPSAERRRPGHGQRVHQTDSTPGQRPVDKKLRR